MSLRGVVGSEPMPTPERPSSMFTSSSPRDGSPLEPDPPFGAGPETRPPTASSNDPRQHVSRVVAAHSRVVVLGDPGSGKTTLVRWLANRHVTAQLLGRSNVVDDGEGIPADHTEAPARFPIYVRAGALVSMDGWRRLSLTEFLVADHHARDFPPSALPDLLNTELSAGRCLVLLDGMDEIPSAHDRRAVVDRIGSFVQRWGSCGNHFVVTSRLAGYWTSPLAGFDHYQVCDMDLEREVPLFLDRYCLALERLEQPAASVEHIAASAASRSRMLMKGIRQNRGVAAARSKPAASDDSCLGSTHRSPHSAPASRRLPGRRRRTGRWLANRSTR